VVLLLILLKFRVTTQLLSKLVSFFEIHAEHSFIISDEASLASINHIIAVQWQWSALLCNPESWCRIKPGPAVDLIQSSWGFSVSLWL